MVKNLIDLSPESCNPKPAGWNNDQKFHVVSSKPDQNQNNVDQELEPDMQVLQARA